MSTSDRSIRARKLSLRGGIGRPTVDVQRLAKALASPGIDPRIWASSGTVGVIDENGEFSTKDTEAVYVDRLGLVVSIRLEPSGEVITARYNGIACGRYGFMLIPLRGGDEVGVNIPDGDLNSPGITVTGILSNETAQIPVDWNNDRVLFSFNVPLEIRGPQITITSPLLQLNRRGVARGPDGI